MIKVIEKVFKLDTKNSTYVFRVSPFGHLFSEYYGDYISDVDNFDFSKEKIVCPAGSSVIYDDEKDGNYTLDQYSLEVATVGKGDYKTPSIIIKTKEGYLLDLIYQGYEIHPNFKPLDNLPSPHGDMEELVISLKDKVLDIVVQLIYIVDEENDVIIRNTRIINHTDEKITIEKVASMQLDMVNHDFEMVSLYGGWGFEAQKAIAKLVPGIYMNDSKTGSSSNRHNPFFMLKEKDASYSYGRCYAFNLMYSGNHFELVELSSFHKVRIQTGINPFCFSSALAPNEEFISPLAVMTYSSKGTNLASIHFHDFIKNRVIRPGSVNKDRPLVINNWEATYMKFTESKLKSIIKQAQKLGLEMFVLDDGWFGRRNDDTKGLGDYNVNKKKLPHGLKGISRYSNKKDLSFGLWFEPEMVNMDSALYEAHPDWVICSSIRPPSKGRHQMVLDLSKREVQEYIISSVNNILDSYPISYVKWDMNRHISDVSTSSYEAGEIYHRYMLGLYHILEKINLMHSDITFEGCSSGGNRFDLGMLAYFDQIWTSDDTDAYERINIQSGYALAYPLRCLSNHVSAYKSHQLLRSINFDTKFNVACFGALGYEMDLSTFTPAEEKAIKAQIAFYKEHRDLIQNGDFYQLKDIKTSPYALWMVVSKDKKEAILAYFNGLQIMNPSIEDICLVGLENDALYSFEVRSQVHDIKEFGGLVNMILPFHVNERGFLINTISKHKTIPGEKESYILSGSALMNGALKLNQQWMGTGFNDQVRALGDFGSRLYYIRQIDKQ